MAGGQGSRLRPLTLTRPKPMVEVLGRPVIDFVKDAMVDAGVEHLVVTTGYRGEQLSAHVEQWSTHSGISARINQEAVPMGTAGSVRLLLDELTDTFVVGSGDAVASFDIQALIEAHRSHGAKVTMALWEVEDPTGSGGAAGAGAGAGAGAADDDNDGDDEDDDDEGEEEEVGEQDRRTPFRSAGVRRPRLVADLKNHERPETE